MTSRLDRLFVLLESGTSNVTRKAAAKQLGEVQKLHPHELHNLLARIKTYLNSSTWDTRIAAGQAVRAVIENVPYWDPIPVLQESSDKNTQIEKNERRLNLELFDINNIIKNGIHLTGSEGKEYDLQDDSGSYNVSKQKQILNAMIGLDVTEQISIEMNDLLTSEDFAGGVIEKPKSSKTVGEIVQMELNQVEGLSIRERNRAQRKARQIMSKQRSIENEDDEPKQKKLKSENYTVDSSENVPDSTGSWNNVIHWPFQSFCEQLIADLFNPRWETRHGAAIGLREIITCHGEGAGKTANTTIKQMEEDHKLWLQDLAFRILCVLSLDRFGDFVSDQVVAPVREACAQVMGTVLKLMDKSSIKIVLKIVSQLVNQNEWEARHGGLLALKYMLAVRKDLVKDLLVTALPLAVERLCDEVDDVSAVAAASLIPVAPEIVSEMPKQVANIISKLWDLLLDQDDLAAACNNFMGLLAAFLSLPGIKKYIISQPISELVHRLWPFLSHNATTVRKSTLQTLQTLTTFPKGQYNDWDVELLKTAMRHIFQRVLIEPCEDIQSLATKVWTNLIENSHLSTLLMAACPCFGSWLCLTMQNSKVAFDPSLLISAEMLRCNRKNGKAVLETSSNQLDQKIYLGGCEATNLEVRKVNATRARYLASKMLGKLSYYIVKLPPEFEENVQQEVDTPIQCYVKVLLSHLNTKSSLQRLVCGLVICEWAKLQSEPLAPKDLIARLHECLNENIYFDEIGFTFTRLIQETKDYMFTLKYYDVEVDESFMSPVLSLDQILQLTKNPTSSKISKKALETLEERRKNIYSTAKQLLADQTMLSITCQAALAGAVTELKSVTGKLNPVIKPLMESIKREESEILQQISAEEIANLIELFMSRTPCPNSKIISNLCTFLCSDSEFTPRINKISLNSNFTDKDKRQNDILTLIKQQRLAEKSLFKRQNSGNRGPGRPPTFLTEGCSLETLTAAEENQKEFQIQRRGATMALEAIVKHFGKELPNKLPNLWETLCCQSPVADNPEDLIVCLQVLELTCSSVHPSLLPELLSKLPKLCELLAHESSAIRHMSARCIAALSLIGTEEVMRVVIDIIIPLLGVSDCDIKRQGAAEAIFCVIDRLQLRIIPYVVLLVIPLLGRMSEQNCAVRTICTQSFATIVQLLPLDSPILDGENLSSEKAKERSFLRYLLNPKTIPDYKIPVPIKASLRSYQQAGVNWLAFLNKYKLHGILCDDMGLGKTLQSICILAGDHYHRKEEYLKKGSPDCKPLPSIVICPPTLTGHWMYEVEKFLSKEYLNPLQYSGPPAEREKLRPKVGDHNLIIASYDIVRNDIEFFKNINWNYCILDEGHIIKNGKTKASKAIKSLVANHRLILSGTPIQNNVLELWSLFDFLMPGLLSTEKQFNAKYSRPILASWDPKSSPKEQEAGVIAMESLHRQILPFLLRRMKEDVLKDLPPKITQDYFCELSQLQEQLYEDFSKSQAHQSLQDSLSNPSHSNTHIFQALRYLQNVCNHPKLVLTPQHPEYEKVMVMLSQQGTSMDEIQHACKLPALKQLLLDCGIGTPVTNDVVYINQHRALIFCQLKSMLDIIETDLLKKHLPNVSYLRLDGSIPASQRHSVVNKFNSDPSIDVLLLTTQVGGLGLNLTGADTVIFVEHDWNPMKDLQAMDRAHRIGQKKVVNVYRLITRGTLEEKIMGLQKFKLFTANTVISDENGALETMRTDKLFDLFTLKEDNPTGTSSKTSNSGTHLKVPGFPVKNLLENLPELWEQQQYEKEFDLSNFIANLNK